MRIGIDGGALSITDDRLKVGVYRVAYNLVKEMQVLNAKNDYRVYSFGRGERGTHSLAGPNTHFVQLIRPGYQSIWQTVDIVKHPIDVYLGISQSIPLLPKILCDVSTIGFIYDVGFLDYPECYPGSANTLNRQTAALVARSNHIITITEASKDALRRAYHVPDGRVSVAYLGVDSHFTGRGEAKKPKHPYFLFVGSLKRGKNVPLMLRAFADFLTSVKTIYDFVLVGGDYWMDPEIPDTIRELGLGDRVHIVGHVPDDELSMYYRGAVALLSASLIEGFGLPAAEAMACGLPVIGSNIGSYAEVVGKAGLLVNPKDRAEVTQAMLRYTHDDVFRIASVAAGKHQATQFRWRSFARAVLTAAETLYQSKS